jgi:hypothetical protein
MVIFTILPLYPLRKEPLTSIERRPAGTQGRSGRCGEEKNLALLGIEPRFVRNDSVIIYLFQVP